MSRLDDISAQRQFETGRLPHEARCPLAYSSAECRSMSACPALPLWPAVTLIPLPLDAPGWLQKHPHDFSSVCVPMALGVSRQNGAPPAGSILLCSARRPAPRLPVPSLPGRPVDSWPISSPRCVVATGASPAFGRGVFSHTGPDPNSGVSRTRHSVCARPETVSSTRG